MAHGKKLPCAIESIQNSLISKISLVMNWPLKLFMLVLGATTKTCKKKTLGVQKIFWSHDHATALYY